MFRNVFYCFLQFVHVSNCYYQYSYPRNPTQNHFINSTLLIFNLSTQPSILPGCHIPKTKRSESRKNTSNSRKRFIFKPFSVFSSVLLTTMLRTQHGLRGQNECHLCMSVLGNISTTLFALSVDGNISIGFAVF